MERPIVFMVVTNDEYELPLFCGDTSAEAAEYLGMASSESFSARVSRAKNGVVISQNRKYKYMRLNPITGEVYVGKLPKDVVKWIKENGNPSGGYKPRPIIAIKGETETRYENIHAASAASGISEWHLYHVIKNGRYCCGALWRYAE